MVDHACMQACSSSAERMVREDATVDLSGSKCSPQHAKTQGLHLSFPAEILQDIVYILQIFAASFQLLEQFSHSCDARSQQVFW